MAYYYVKSGETAGTAGGTTKQTGAFSSLAATATWGSVYSAINDGGAGTGDIICVSDASTSAYSVNTNWVGPTSGDFLHVISVDNDAVQTYSIQSTTAQEATTSSARIQPSGRMSINGLYIQSEDDWRYYLANTTVIMNDCTLEVTGTNDWLYFGADSGWAEFNNCTITGISGSLFRVSHGCTVKMVGGAITGYTNLFTSNTGDNGGASASFHGVDLSSVTGYLVQVGGNSAGDDRIGMEFINCKLNASLTGYWQETKENVYHTLTAANSSSASAANNYQYHYSTYGGSVDEDTSIYRTATTEWSGQAISLKCVTTADATTAVPFSFDLPTRFAPLTASATDVITLYLLSATALTDADIWVEASYRDQTNNHESNFISTRVSNVMDTTGTTLSSDSEAWTGAGAETKYYITINTTGTGDEGADCVPKLTLKVAKAVNPFYICPTLGLS